MWPLQQVRLSDLTEQHPELRCKAVVNTAAEIINPLQFKENQTGTKSPTRPEKVSPEQTQGLWEVH